MTLDASLLPVGTIMKVDRYGTMLALIVLFAVGCFNKGFSIKKIVIFTITAIVFSIAALITDRSRLVIFAMLIIVAPLLDLRAEHIVKFFLLTMVLVLCLILIFCKAGIIEDLIYINGTRKAHCLGFSYYSAFPYRVFLCLLMYLFLRNNRISIIECAFLLGISFVVYILTTTRLTFILSVFSVVIDFFLMKGSKLNLNTKMKRILSIMAFPIGISMIFFSLVKYDPNNTVWNQLNSVLNSRMSLAQNGYFDYGIKLFGNYIEMEGNSALEEAMEYFYIDSGFAYSLLGYGLLFTLVAMALYSILFYYSCKTNNKAMFVWILSIWIFSFVNNVWVSVDINPILVFSLVALIQLGKVKRNSKNLYPLAKYSFSHSSDIH